MMLKSLLGIASLFLALDFNAVMHAEVNGVIPSIGGRHFDRRVEISVPVFAQDDRRWSDVRLGPSKDTLGDEGCAVTSAAMVVAFYGIKTDPRRMNSFLTRSGGFTDDGLIHWSRCAQRRENRIYATVLKSGVELGLFVASSGVE